jgi:hypothetical protein
VQFLHDSKTASRVETDNARREAVAAAAAAAAEIESLRQAATPAVDRETQTLRDLLGEAERALAEARNTAVLLTQQQSDFSKERHAIRQELDRLQRMRDAGDRLASIEFMACPRCMQDVRTREVDSGLCRLCLQPDPAATEPRAQPASTYEQEQLTDQLAEMDEQLLGGSYRLAQTHEAIAHRQKLVADLGAQLEARTRDRITPQLQAFTDATRRLTAAQSRQHETEGLLRQWDRADDLGGAAQRLRVRVDELRGELNTAEGRQTERKKEIFDELDAEFAATMAGMGVPGVRTATIHRTKYLPVLNGESFTTFSPPGGIRTATQVAYWISLITVALRRRDTSYPAFLLIDSPRTALNNSDDLAAALYRRVVTQVDAGRDRLQIIIADNELPAAYRRQYAQLDFDYAHPTLDTIPHPGPLAVQTLTSPVGDNA